MENCLKPTQKTEKENVNLGTQVSHYHVASRSLTQVYSKIIKHSDYTPSFTSWDKYYKKSNMLEKLKQLLT